MLDKIHTKKAQVSDTTTWIVATIIIFVILFFFIFGSSVLGKTKGVVGYKEKLFSRSVFSDKDPLLTKSVFSVFQTKDLKTKINLNKTLANQNQEGLFRESYHDKYLEIKRKGRLKWR